MTHVSSDAPPRTHPRWLFAVVGAASAAVALLPWLVTGGGMPLQNLWSEIPAEVPFVPLPIHPYTATLVAALLLFGGVLAGIVGRALGSRRIRWATVLLVVGALVVQAGAIAQSAATTAGTLPDSSDASLYIAALTTGAALASILALVALALVARAPRAGAVIGLTIGAIAAGPWLAALIVPFGTTPEGMPPLLALVQWVPPVLAGLAIAWAGLGTVGRVIAGIVAVILVWVGPAVQTGIGYSLGSRVLWNDPAGMVEAAVQVFGLALLTPELAWRPIVACVVTAALGLGIRTLVARRRTGGTSAAEEGLRHA